MIACALYAISTFLWVAILARLNLSNAYPVAIGFSVLLTCVLGVVVFKEPLGMNRVVGLFLLVVSLFILAPR